MKNFMSYMKTGLKLFVLYIIAAVIMAIVNAIAGALGFPVILSLQDIGAAVLVLLLITIAISLYVNGTIAQKLWKWDVGDNVFMTGIKIVVLNIIVLVVMGIAIAILAAVGLALTFGAFLGGELGAGLLIAGLFVILAIILNLLISGYIAQKLWDWE